MNNFNKNSDLDFDFEDDDFGLLDSDDSKSRHSAEAENVEDNIRRVEEKLGYSQSYDDENDDTSIELEAQQYDEIKAETDKELILYILTDRHTSNMVNYLRSNGVQVSKIFNNIKEAGDQLMFEMNPCRLVVVDTGLGKFTGVASRKEVIDVLSMVDEDHFMTVFYTDKFLKNEVRDSVEVDYKEITWYKYKSTADLAARLLLSKEKFILSDDIEDENESTDDILSSKGLNQTYKESKHSIGQPSITIDQVLKNLDSPDYEELKAYKVKY